MAIRIGAEDKKKLAIASVLGIVAIFFVIHAIAGLLSGPSTSPVPVVAEPAIPSVHRTNARIGQEAGQAQKLESATELDPTLHPEIMRFAETIEYTGNGRNIFSKNSVPPSLATIEKPIASARTGPVVPAGPPPPPPIDLKFYGFATQNGRKTIFLLHGEDIFVAGQGDIVNRRYRVVQIMATSVVIEDLSYNDKQTLSLQDN